MERFTILKQVNNSDYFSLCINDTQEKHKFWIDCSLMDGYGNKENYKTGDLYIDWEFNQYIFYLDNTNDIKSKEYQENGENIDALQEFLDNENNNIIKKFMEVK